MNFDKFFSDSIINLPPSPIRELLKVSQKPGIISLAGGNPSPDTFPVWEIKLCFEKVIEEKAKRILQYSPTEGLPELIESVQELSIKDGINCEKENILITSGSQQGMDLVCKVLLDPGDEVIVELPSYPGSLHTLRSYRAKLIGIPVDSEGLDVEMLDDILKEKAKKGRMPKFIYTIPTFQNPSGVTLSEERRKKIIEIAKKYEILIVEDDPYSKLRYSGDFVKPIKTYDDEGLVVYLNSFSKIFCPGVRVAWIIASKEIIRKMVIAKQGMDLHTSSLNQAIIAEFLKQGKLYPHIEKIIPYYREKRDAMVWAINEYFKERVYFTNPEGGFFTWITLKEEKDTKNEVLKAIEKGVVYVPGISFGIGEEKGLKSSMRLSFATVDVESIKKGVKILSEIF